MAIWSLLLQVASSIVALLIAPLALIRWRRERSASRAVGFFHPYTNDGGGGERVLWCAVKAIQEDYPTLDCYIYTGDLATSESLSARAFDRFGVKLVRFPKVTR